MIKWEKAPDIKKRISHLVKTAEIGWVKEKRIYTYRSTSAKTRACARIWGLSNLWQKTLKVKPAYIVEVISERFDKLNQPEKDKILLHELSHVPKNFSGALVPHIRHGKRSFNRKVNQLINQYLSKK